MKNVHRIVSAACIAFVAACSSDDSGTAGKRITLATQASAEPKLTTTFTTGFGWDVALTKAAIAVSGLYYFDGAPPTAMSVPRQPGIGERLAAFVVGTAWAHPGHYQAGTALGQVLFTEPATLDLFGTLPLSLPDGDGLTGTYRSARLVLPEAAPSGGVLGGHVAVVEGRAQKHDGSSPAPVFFRLVADYADVGGSIKNGSVDGCVFDEASIIDRGMVTLEVKPSIWLNLVDFSKLEPGTADRPTEAHASSFAQGVTQLSAYAFHYTK